MAAPIAPRNRNDFKVAIFCALPLEADAVQSVFDKCWENVGKRYGRAAGDQNAYTTGVIGSHNVVLVHMPRMGVTSAAIAAAGLRSSFTRIQLALVVGICGVVPIHPETQEEIALGDVIVSTAVTQYDFGRQYPNGFKRKKEIDDSLGRAGAEVQAFVNMLQSRYSRQRLKKDLKQLLYSEDFRAKNPDAVYPGVLQDELYDASYSHQHRVMADCSDCDGGDDICTRPCAELGCEKRQLIQRKRHSALTAATSVDVVPIVHFGRFGSANTVMKSGVDRDQIATSDKVIAFEMEGAGVWEQHQTVVIKAACDYADSHKNKSWQPYAAKMAAAFLAVFLTEWVTADEMIDADDPEEGMWYVPFDHIPGFVGRVEELSRIKRIIIGNVYGKTVSILGLGGVGKSRFTLELAYSLRSEYPEYSIFWVQGATKATFENDMLEVGRELGIEGINNDNADVKALVKERLSIQSEKKWIMIVDNADDEELWGQKPKSDQRDPSLTSYLPRAVNGSIVVTTRTRSVATFLAGKQVIEMSDLPPEQAISMLKNGLERPDLLDSNETALKLVNRLENLPLAIVQAISFINRTQEPASAYLRLLDQPEERVIELLSRDFEEPSGHRYDLHPVATTWLISFDQVRKKNTLAAKYLTYMACLLEKNISLSLLPPSDPQERIDAIAVLTGYSFLKRQTMELQNSAVEPLYDMHRLVHLCTRNWLRKEGLLQAEIAECTKTVAQQFPLTHYEFRDQWKAFLPHSQWLIADPNTEDLHARFELMRKIAYCFQLLGQYRETTEMFVLATEWAEKALGPNHSLTLTSSSEAGLAMLRSGEYAKAEIWLTKSIEGQRRYMKNNNQIVLRSMASLAWLYKEHGRWDEAEKLAVEVVESSKRIFGIDHHDTLEAMTVLGRVYKGQNKPEASLKLGLQVVEIRKRRLGLEDPDTLSSMGTLARTYVDQGRLDEAQELQGQVCETLIRVLGPEHPETLRSKGTLASTYIDLGQLKEAQELEEYLVDSMARVLGPDHPETLTSKANLALVYSMTKRLEEAEVLHAQALEARTRVLGPEHRDTLWSLHYHAFTMWRLGRQEEAIIAMRSCLEIHQRISGHDHKDTENARKALRSWTYISSTGDINTANDTRNWQSDTLPSASNRVQQVSLTMNQRQGIPSVSTTAQRDVQNSGKSSFRKSLGRLFR